jgi:hypothetical protein
VSGHQAIDFDLLAYRWLCGQWFTGLFQGVSNFAINGMVLVVLSAGGTMVGKNEITGMPQSLDQVMPDNTCLPRYCAQCPSHHV